MQDNSITGPIKDEGDEEDGKEEAHKEENARLILEFLYMSPSSGLRK